MQRTKPSDQPLVNDLSRPYNYTTNCPCSNPVLEYTYVLGNVEIPTARIIDIKRMRVICLP